MQLFDKITFMNILSHGLINKGEIIAVGLSGGVDSMALCHCLKQLSIKQGFTLVAINVEHGIRGEESKKDSLFVKDYCNAQGITLYEYVVNAPLKAEKDKLSLEQAARILRYECFYDAIKSGKCDKVATAHHLSDNAETVLFNALRGSSIKGISGIAPNLDGKIIRPLLQVSKQEIIECAISNGIEFREDSTNLCDDYTRNFLRLNVMPEIKKVFPEAEKSLCRLGSLAKVDDDYLEGVANASLKAINGNVSFACDLHPAISGRCVINALKYLGVEKDWEKVHVDSVINLKNLSNGASVNLPLGVVAIREYDLITLYKPTEDFNEELPLKLGETPFCDGIIKLESLAPKGLVLTDGIYLDQRKIPQGAVIRTYRADDLFTKFGGGTKKLCDYFTDKKIPRRIRHSIPLIAHDNDVLAISGICVSEKVKVDCNSKIVLSFTFIK